MLHHRLLATAALVAFAAVGAATPAHAGPPWISIELPANPLDPTTRGAFLLVHTFHHDAAMASALTGRAEGLVNGKRQTIPLSFESTSRTGVRALRKLWPDGGTWVLVITVGEHGDATALVGIGSDGTVHSVKVPNRTDGRHTVPTKVSQADVEAMLTRLASAEPSRARDGDLALALGALLLMPIGLVVTRRIA